MENVLTKSKLEYIFGITSFAWHELPSRKLFTNELETLLEQKLDLSDYGTGIKQIVIGFIAYPVHLSYLADAKEEREFVKSLKLASISIPLNYEGLMSDNDEEAFQRVKSAYFEGVKEVLPMLEVKNFDIDRFIIDLEKVLNN